MLTGGQLLHDLRDSDVQIATTPKDLVWSQDKVSLFHYRPLAPQRVHVPLLICYGLVGRWTMTDLQEDRSLVRNLLNLGLDLYVVDWGNPSRADRYLTLDDYILGYLSRLRRRNREAGRRAEGQPDGCLRRRRFHHGLCCAGAGTGQHALPYHHADRFPCRYG